MIPYIIILAIIPSIIIGLFFTYIKFNSLHIAGNKSQKYIAYQLVPINFIIAIGSASKHYIKDNYIAPPKPIKIEATMIKKDDLVVVLAIGETSRQLNSSLYGYEKNTNPLLQKQKDLFVLNGIAKYGSTIWALPQILSRDNIKLPSITSHVGIVMMKM
jgi:glucan phosphoethanolaminetransferase (alkaline phosphatase superfamily)